jgi:hypothetical protein
VSATPAATDPARQRKPTTWQNSCRAAKPGLLLAAELTVWEEEKGSAVTVEDGTAYASRFQARYAGTALPGERSYNLCMPITRLDRGLHAQQPNLKPSGGPQ